MMKVRALDTHAHVTNTKEGTASQSTFIEFMVKHYKFQHRIMTDEEMAEDVRSMNVKMLPVAWDTELNTGLPAVTNDYIASLVKRWPEVFPSGWACIDPWRGKMAIKELERCVNELGLVGVKFQQVLQAFYPNDVRFYPLWEKCVELNVPVQFHAGFTGIGAGAPGGMGQHLKYTNPMYIDDVAADFPDLTIIALHLAWPWQDEMLAILRHKGNVYNDLSGWAPKLIPPQVRDQINATPQMFLFGSDYPALSPTRWLDSFERDYSPEICELVFWKNAKQILGDKLPEHTWE
jgi:predicted TIM-barrel fold metal-dependent hydrolase